MENNKEIGESVDLNLSNNNTAESDLLTAASNTGHRQFREVNVDEVLACSTNENTKRKTQNDLKVFNDFLLAKNETRAVEVIPPDPLNEYICQFLLSVTKKNGQEYEPTTLRSFISSLERHLKSKNLNLSIVNGPEFHKAREVLKSKQKMLKKQGYGNKPKTAEPLTEAQLEKLYQAESLGDSNPRALIHSLWLVCTTHFGMKTGQEVHSLCWGDVQLGIDEETDQEFITLNTERQTKTRPGSDPKDTR